MKRLIIVLAGLLLTSTITNAYELVKSNPETIRPEVSYTRHENSIEVEYKFHGAQIKEDNLYEGTYMLVIPGFSQCSEPGKPAILGRSDTFEIPSGYTTDISIISVDYELLDVSLSPAKPVLMEDEKGYSFENVLAIEEYSGWLPESPVVEDGLRIYRDRNILYEMSFQYHTITKTT